MILKQNGLPTPDFAVLQTPNDPIGDMAYPLIVKPKSEAVSFGLKVVNDEAELRAAVKVIHDEFNQAVLVEQFIQGREVNVGLLGNSPPEAFPPVELVFGSEGPAIYTYEDKTGRSGRTIMPVCPAPIGEALLRRAKELAIQAFTVLGCYDCARVDMRIDADNNLYILEVNSLPSLGEHGSYLVGADKVGLDFTKFINRLVEVASARYFGTPRPTEVTGTAKQPSEAVFSFVTARRDQLERRLGEWVNLSSRTSDPVGPNQATKEAQAMFVELGMKPVPAFSGANNVNLWQTDKGFKKGMLFVVNLDVPVDLEFPVQAFRRDPEWLHGDGIGSSRAPLVMLEFALRSLRSMRRLRQLPLGVLCYSDEGLDARHSGEVIAKAADLAAEVFVLRPGLLPDAVVTARRGQRTFQLVVEDDPVRLGRFLRKPDLLRRTSAKLDSIAALTSPHKRISVSTIEVKTERLPMRLPHRILATIVLNYPTVASAEATEAAMRRILDKGAASWNLLALTDRPPFVRRKAGVTLAGELAAVAKQWDMRLDQNSSAWPSAAGLIPAKRAAVCGVGPVARDLRTPQEAVSRLSLVQRTLMVAEFLASRLPK
jgi:D-alanine-D-alanine ligase